MAGARVRKQITDLDRRIKAQVVALEEALAGMDGVTEEIQTDDLAERLSRLPNLTTALEERRPTSNARSSTHSTCRSPTTGPGDGSKSPRPSPRLLRTPSKMQEPSRRRTLKWSSKT
jgi:hypothetical protein